MAIGLGFRKVVSGGVMLYDCYLSIYLHSHQYFLSVFN